MSVFRVITRIIPLSSEGAFEPASFDQITGGNVGDIKVFNLTEPNSGMKYRIERVEYVQNAGPGESIETVNDAFAEKLKSVPGFEKLRADDLPLNPYDKSFQLKFPKVLFGKSSDESSKSTESFKISIVKNFNFKKASSKPKKPVKYHSTSKERNIANGDIKHKISRLQSESRTLFKAKYPKYLKKKKKFVWGKSLKNRKTKKHSRSDKSSDELLDEHIHQVTDSQNDVCPSTNQETGARKPLKIKISRQRKVKNITNGHNSSERDNVNERNGDICSKSKEMDDSTDDSLDLESGDLVINVPESFECSSEKELSNIKSDKSGFTAVLKGSDGSVIINKVINSSASDDSSLGEASPKLSESPKEADNQSKDVFIVPHGHPAYQLLLALKKYFVNGECLICGFVPEDKDFNGFEHMKSHTLSNSFTSSYKCSCCDEKFANPRNLYMHALSREKSYKYMCNICLLKFKRKHYLSRHTAKSHIKPKA